MLFGEILKETNTHITLRVAADRGDAKEYGLVGDFKLDAKQCRVLNRRDLAAARPRLLDEVEVAGSLLEDLARQSPSPVD